MKIELKVTLHTNAPVQIGAVSDNLYETLRTAADCDITNLFPSDSDVNEVRIYVDHLPDSGGIDISEDGELHISDEDGEIVSWVSDEYEDESAIAAAMNAVHLYYILGPKALRRLIGKGVKRA